MGAERLQARLQESLAVATPSGAMKPSDLARVILDTTVQPKNVTFPTDAKLMNRAREKLVKLAIGKVSGGLGKMHHGALLAGGAVPADDFKGYQRVGESWRDLSHTTAIALAGFSGAVATYGRSHGHGDQVSPACANSTRQGGL
jgi:hypothetical protein